MGQNTREIGADHERCATVKLLRSHVTCQQAVELISDYLDGQLSRRTRSKLERHWAAGDDCETYLSQMRVVIATTGGITPESMDPTASDAIVDLFEKFHDDGATQ